MTRLATARQSASSAPARAETVDLRSLALRALGRMYCPNRGLFAFRMRQRAGRAVMEGVSERYTAIALIGLSAEKATTSRNVLCGEDVHDVCRRLLEGVHRSENLGDVALILWAAVALQVDQAWKARDHLRDLQPCDRPHPTVELSWALTALAFDAEFGESAAELRRDIATRLVSSFVAGSDMFPHWPAGAGHRSLRSHVSCFADLVVTGQVKTSHLRAG